MFGEIIEVSDEREQRDMRDVGPVEGLETTNSVDCFSGENLGEAIALCRAAKPVRVVGDGKLQLLGDILVNPADLIHCKTEDEVIECTPEVVHTIREE